MEKWKEIKNFESLYEVSNIGNVRNKKTKKLISKRCDKDGYEIVNLYNLGKIKTAKVHRLVAEAFLENIENKPCVDHINTIKNDNRLENLRWCTYKENSNNILTKEHLKQGIRKGENHPFYRKHLNESTKEKIREKSLGRKHTQDELIKMSKSQLGNKNHMYGKTGALNKRSKTVLVYKNDSLIIEFNGVYELSRKSESLLGVKLNPTKISAVCLGKRKTHKGFTFKYKGGEK